MILNRLYLTLFDVGDRSFVIELAIFHTITRVITVTHTLIHYHHSTYDGTAPLKK